MINKSESCASILAIVLNILLQMLIQKWVRYQFIENYYLASRFAYKLNIIYFAFMV